MASLKEDVATRDFELRRLIAREEVLEREVREAGEKSLEA